MLTEAKPALITATESLAYKGRSAVKQRYEQSLNPEDNFPYHNTLHSWAVRKRFKELAQFTFVSDRLITLGEAIIEGHDRFIRYKAETRSDSEFEKVVMVRDRGNNERVSAEETVADMRDINNKLGEEVFTREDEELTREAYIATVPGFDPDLHTVTQPNLTRDTSPLARLIALADIGSAGMDSIAFVKDGNALFMEEQLDVFRRLRNPEPLCLNEIKWYRERMIYWTESQIEFARGRRILLDEELDGLPEDVKREIKNCFCQFNLSIKKIENLVRERERMPLPKLLRNMGYYMDSRAYLLSPNHIA